MKAHALVVTEGSSTALYQLSGSAPSVIQDGVAPFLNFLGVANLPVAVWDSACGTPASSASGLFPEKPSAMRTPCGNSPVTRPAESLDRLLSAMSGYECEQSTQVGDLVNLHSVNLARSSASSRPGRGQRAGAATKREELNAGRFWTHKASRAIQTAKRQELVTEWGRPGIIR